MKVISTLFYLINAFKLFLSFETVNTYIAVDNLILEQINEHINEQIKIQVINQIESWKKAELTSVISMKNKIKIALACIWNLELTRKEMNENKKVIE